MHIYKCELQEYYERESRLNHCTVGLANCSMRGMVFNICIADHNVIENRFHQSWVTSWQQFLGD